MAHSTVKLLLLPLLAWGTSIGSLAAEPNGSGVQTKARLVHFDRDFGDDSNDLEQTALALEGNYRSPRVAGLMVVSLSGYVVEDISNDGAIEAELLAVDGDEVSGFALLGEAYLDLSLDGAGVVRLGRTRHDSMLLASSGSRAVPSTFQGASVVLDPAEGLSVYGALFDKWSPRASDDFEGFATDNTVKGGIDWVAVLGLRYAAEPYSVQLEYYRSQDFLSKTGLRATYRPPIDWNGGLLTLTSGVFTSDANGELFVTGSESGDLDDEDILGAVAGVTDSDANGLGGYLDLEWNKGGFSAGITLTLIDEIWLEDNFAGDHGTSPFPTTSRAGPDLTNTGETVIGGRIGYDWRNVIEGLNTTFRFARGYGAENSTGAALGTADERWWEIDVRYHFAWAPGFGFRGIYHDYASDETGSVDGVKDDDRDIRLYLDYVHTF